MSGSGSGSSRSATSAGASAEPAVDAGERAAPGPADLARRGELVEQRRGVPGQPRGQDQRLQRARRQRRPGELLDDPRTSSAPGARRIRPRRSRRGGLHALPGRQEPAQRALLDGLDLGPQPGQRGPPQAPQHLGVAVLGLTWPPAPRHRRAGRSSPRTSRPDADQPVEHPRDHGDPEPEPGGRLRRRERPVRAGVAEQQVAQRIGHRLGERLGHADGQRGARARRARGPASSIAVHRSSPAIRTRMTRRAASSSVEPLRARRPRAAASAVVRSPRNRSRSAAPSASRACRSAASRCSDCLDLGQRPPGRAARGSPRSPAARPAAWSRATARRPGARPAGRRPRRGTSRRSRRAGCARTATATAVATSTTCTLRGLHVAHQRAQARAGRRRPARTRASPRA